MAVTDVTGAAPFGLGTEAMLATGAFTSDGNATSITIGYLPRDFYLVNETDGITYRKIQGMAPANTLKGGAGGASIDTTSLISFPTDPGLNEPGNTVLVAAGALPAGKKISWACFG